MALSLLSVIQKFCKRTGLASPGTVVGNTDAIVIQLLAMLEEAGIQLRERGAWQALIREATHTTTAAENQGAMTTIASDGFNWVMWETLYDRTNQLPLIGPCSPNLWQFYKAVAVTGPRYTFRIRGGNLLVQPTPTAGDTWAFEYVSRNWITNSGGASPAEYFAADTDLILLPDEVLLAELRWRWKKEKGQAYAEDFNSAEMMISAALGRDAIKPTLHMDGGMKAPQPGIFVSPGSWMQ